MIRQLLVAAAPGVVAGLLLWQVLFRTRRADAGRFSVHPHAYLDTYAYRLWDRREHRWLAGERGIVHFTRYDDAVTHAQVLNDREVGAHG